MRNPFETSGKGSAKNRLLGLDSWLDDTLFRMFSDMGDRWEVITIFFRRFREVCGLRRRGVELEAAEVEVDGGLEVFPVAVAAGGDPDRLDA